MTYKLYNKSGEYENTIVCDEEFIKFYSKLENLTYELIETEETEVEIIADPITTLQQENKELKEKITVLEECIVELANKIYE